MHDKAQDWSELKGRVHKEVNASGHRAIDALSNRIGAKAPRVSARGL